jgi:hypothetical protein
MSAMLDALAASGMLPKIALAVLAIEAAIFVAVLRGRPALLASLLLNAASGAALMVALYAALAGTGGLAIATFLAISLAAHCCDLAIRLRKPNF